MNNAMLSADEVADSFSQPRYAQDSRMVVRFYIRAVKNEFKTNLEGRPIFDETEYIQIRAAGDQTSLVDTPVTLEHSQYRFPEQYAKFKQGLSQTTSGTPLDQWPQLTVGQVAELKGVGIHTVEHLAELPDNLASKFMGSHELRRKASTFLKVANDDAAANKLTDELGKRDAIIAEMQEQLKALAADKPKRQTKSKVDDGETPPGDEALPEFLTQ
jgi:hypothetical protein